MEEKKLDVKSIIGFVLIFGILLFMMWNNQPSPEEVAAEKAKQALVEAEQAKAEAKVQEDVKVVDTQDFTNVIPGDSLQQLALQNKIGAFAFGASLPSEDQIVDNGVLHLKFS